jgi:hypothetical protein
MKPHAHGTADGIGGVLDVTIRPATVADAPFLASMLVEAVNWDPTRPPVGLAQAVRDDRFAPYTHGWGRPTDFGVIALADGPIGAAFATSRRRRLRLHRGGRSGGHAGG